VEKICVSIFRGSAVLCVRRPRLFNCLIFLRGPIVIDALPVSLLVFASWLASKRQRFVGYWSSGEFLVSSTKH
jgi:hypothetical protein